MTKNERYETNHYRIHLRTTVRGSEIWLNRNEDFDGLCVGLGPTPSAALTNAMNELAEVADEMIRLTGGITIKTDPITELMEIQ